MDGLLKCLLLLSSQHHMEKLSKYSSWFSVWGPGGVSGGTACKYMQFSLHLWSARALHCHASPYLATYLNFPVKYTHQIVWPGVCPR